MYCWKDCIFLTKDGQAHFRLNNLTIENNSFNTIIGQNGSGKTLFAKAVCNELKLSDGITPEKINVANISFEKQMEFIEEDFKRRNSDDEKDLQGYTPMEMFLKINEDKRVISELCKSFGFSYALNRSYYKLSSGEGRKTLIIEALLKNPDVIVLDSPFDGLDIATREDLQKMLMDIHKQGKTIIVIVNRFDEISPVCQNIGLIMDKELVKFGPKDDILNNQEVRQLTHYEKLPKIYSLPEVPEDCRDNLDRSIPIAVLKNVTVKYEDHIVLNNISWTINPYEHWQICGPNGCGKSTLLSLITGDNPQGYGNDLTLFGIKRGSGETIWDIKKHIGYVSPSFHLDYRVSCSIINVILSGYFDTIGLYEQPGDKKISLALQWLRILGLKEQANNSFRSLSYGQQRLVLIVRALVKKPPLLILDEPLQGLDSLSRELVKRFVEFLMKNGETQILFVSHHEDDAPHGINHRLIFKDNGTRTFDVEIQ
ncbi:MAG: molybdate ABC transporter ATP-binding protein ModF [Ruminobacter sp.]|jgi:molybdate transport system ATP-binding protein|nr:molybdate ABC transporter ATP-binding protein ModF [Ruminobacter sp.]